MPSFEYRALDQTSQSSTGWIDAPSANDAVLRLGQQGLKVQSIKPGNQPVPMHRPAQQAAPRVDPVVMHQPSRPRPTAAPTVQASNIDYPTWGHKQQFFHLTQVSDLLKAGVNPAEFYKTLAAQQRDGSGNAMLEISRLVSEGSTISDAMARFPRMFSRNVVGIVRAGEIGGFLPDAAAKAGDMEHAAHKWNRFFTWVWVIIVNAVGGIPVALMLSKGLTNSFFKGWDTGVSENPMVTMWGLFKHETFWQITIITGLLLAFLFVWKKPFCRYARHWLGLMYPYIRKRAINESLMIFSWTLTRLSQSGVYPQRAYALATDAIPNDVISSEFHRIGEGMRENSPLSAPFAHNKYMPVEYQHIATTGEMTGQVPSAIDQIYRMAESEFDYQATKSKFVMATAGVLWFTITGLAIIAVIIKYYYGDLVTRFMNENTEIPIHAHL